MEKNEPHHAEKLTKFLLDPWKRIAEHDKGLMDLEKIIAKNHEYDEAEMQTIKEIIDDELTTERIVKKINELHPLKSN